MRNEFNLSHEHKTSFDMGYLIPICTEEVLPGDTFIHNTSAMCRVAPLANPLMHNVDVSVHHWYVPNRILWDAWEDFITGDDTQTHPTKTLDTDLELCDYFGMYPQTGLVVNALPFRAYNAIYNHNFRDQDLQTERATDDDTLARVCWEKDYFTTARLTPQVGDAISIGFNSGQVDVISTNASGERGPMIMRSTAAGTVMTGANVSLSRDTATGALEDNNGTQGYLDPNGSLFADLTTATGGIDIDELRRSIALQRFAEARARFGTRYEDYLRFLGVNPADGRLDRPEYLGGGKQNLSFSEVITTAEGSTTVPGDLYGHGIGSVRSRRYRKMFEEHGWVMTTMFVRPKTGYMQAMPRKFSRTDPMDYWQKELETLPWQAVPHKEIYAPDNNTTTFGYVPRYDEYRHSFNYASGTFRTTDKDWHMMRDLSAEPTLNSSFVTCTPTDRIYSDNSMPEIQASVYNNIRARRLVRRSASISSI